MAPILDKHYSWKIYRDEIERQGAALRTRLPAFVAQAAEIAQRIIREQPSSVYVTGSGDSYVAALTAQHVYRELGGVHAWAVEAFDIAPYHARLLSAQTLVVSNSISGSTKTAIDALATARDCGAPTLVITNTPGSPATTFADHVLELDVPSIDTSGYIPSTMSYMAGLAAQYCVAAAIGEASGRAEAGTLASIESALAHAFDSIDGIIAALDAPVRNFAGRHIRNTPCLVGGGVLHGVAFFGEAKIIESALCHVSVQHVEEWSHIRRFSAGPQSPMIALATPGRSRARMLEIMRVARRLDTEIIAIAEPGDAGVAELAHEVWNMPVLQNELIQAFTCAIPLQLLAYWAMHVRDLRPFNADVTPIVI